MQIDLKVALADRLLPAEVVVHLVAIARRWVEENFDAVHNASRILAQFATVAREDGTPPRRVLLRLLMKRAERLIALDGGLNATRKCSRPRRCSATKSLF